jgi:hypothetical protein
MQLNKQLYSVTRLFNYFENRGKYIRRKIYLVVRSFCADIQLKSCNE